ALDGAEEGRAAQREAQALAEALQPFLKERDSRPQAPKQPLAAPDAERIDPATQARARTAVAGLASEQFSEREAASETLRALGAAAVPEVRAALEHPDAEVRARAREILTRLEAPPPAVQACAYGRYRGLLRVIEVPEDESTYGAYRDYGPWSGSAWKGHEDLPAGNWVYVAPKWYIWKEEWKAEAR
ncbi:MAG: hypothetical protein KIS92_26220, partial [Planctomycetota bacterium]|nr:hypothetical protein [Planctomycetota bacterium]